MTELKSTRSLSSILSVYQLSILQLMSRGVRLCTNEGHNYRVWLETESGTELKFRLLKRSVNALYEQCLIVPVPNMKPTAPYKYVIAPRGMQVLGYVTPQKMTVVHSKLSSTLSASISCPRSD